MRKTILLSLLVILMISIGCSSDEDNNPTQTFLEKYDGVVWLEDNTISVDDYAFLIQLLNSSKSIIDNEMPDGIDGESYCDTETISNITVNEEDTLVGSSGTETYTLTVTNSGEDLKMEVIDTDPSYPYEEITYYSRSNYSMNCN